MLSDRHISRMGLLLTFAFATLVGGCGDQSPSSKASTESSPLAKAEVQPATGEVSIEQLKSKADKGDADAMVKLSRHYRYGKGTEANPSLADHLLKQAATLNHPEALYKLAFDHAFKIQVDWPFIDGATNKDRIKSAEKHYTEAVRLYEQAHAAGHKEAEEQLGVTILFGLDDFVYHIGAPPAEVPKSCRGDVARALPHLERAAANGSVRAMVALYRIHDERVWGRQNMALAREWMEKLNAVSDAKKIEEIGRLLIDGVFAKKEQNPFYVKGEEHWPAHEKIALPFIERAATAGQTDSQVLLARLFLRDSNGNKTFVSIAAKWLEKASIAGDNWACVELGKLYMKGEGVMQDFSAAVKLIEQAATSQAKKVKLDDSNVETEVHDLVKFEAQFLMGIVNEKGLGVQKDLVRAHAWYNIAATNGFEKAVSARKALTPQLTVDQLAEAQALAKNWKPGSNSLTGVPLEKSGAIASAGAPAVKVGTGTIFIVSKAGHAVTNQHVAGGCRELRVQGRDGLATLLNEDKINDLALLQLQSAVTDAATIAAEPGKLRQGDEIAAFGFPLRSVLSSGGNLTPGVVSALTGIGNNINQIQITAPIQPGSSGSPVLNKKGEVIGVVSMKLDDAKMVEATGQIGQNINFAISGQTLKAFLDTHKVTYRTGSFLSFEKSTADLADEARKWTMVVECWK